MTRRKHSARTKAHRSPRPGGRRRRSKPGKRSKRSKRPSAIFKLSRRVDRIEATDLTDGLLWIVVFGPGHGEGILVRLPNGEVGVVDGCRNDETECPIAHVIKGLKPAELLFVCLTHPHEDHYKGLARLLKAHAGKVQKVWHVFALTANERKSIVSYAKRHYSGAKKHRLTDKEEPRKMQAVFEQIMAAGKHPTMKAQRRELYVDRRLYSSNHGGLDLGIDAWGPTDEDIMISRNKFLAKIKKPPATDDLPNQVSGAILVRWGTSRVLLAGDLYSNSQDNRGWGETRALASASSPVQIVNAAHHASHNAHDTELWRAMSPSLAIVTPFNRARMNNAGKPLHPPRPSDIRTLLDSGAEVVITSKPDWLGRHLNPKPPAIRGVRSRSTLPSVPGVSPLFGSLTPPPDADDARHGVAIGMDGDGNIKQVVLAGDAAFYI